MPYGTYIEVDAYYRSINEEKVGSGDIKYRFMLGKNITTNYDAERNHHYKLTLKFKNFANDADWHIEYAEPEPGIEVPNPYYISYLYNRTMDLPIKINPGYAKVESVKAEIINNGWAPIGADANNFDYYHLIWKARMYGMDFFLCAVLLQPYLQQQKKMLVKARVLFMQKATKNTITELNEEIANMP